MSDVVLERDKTHAADRLVPDDLRNNIPSFSEYIYPFVTLIVYVSSFLGLHLARGTYRDTADDRKMDQGFSQDAGMN